MKKIKLLAAMIIVAGIFTGCATTGSVKSGKAKVTDLDSCIVDENYDFIFEIVNNTDEAITFTNGIKEDYTNFNTIKETKSFVVNKGESYQLKYDLGLIEKFSGVKKEKLRFFTFMSSENNTVIDGNEKSICIYEKDGRYVNDRLFYDHMWDQRYQLVLAERKYIFTLTKVGKEINVYGKIEDLSDFVYDEIVPGNGRSPIKLQLRNSKEYIEVDWRYCNYHKENRGFDNGGNFSTSMDGGDWRFSGEKYELLLNYNRNNDYYMLPNRDEIRPYTVEELEKLIGIKGSRTSAEGIKSVK